jgi:hypothetical protein
VVKLVTTGDASVASGRAKAAKVDFQGVLVVIGSAERVFGIQAASKPQ